MNTINLEFNEIINDFKKKIKSFQERYNLDDGNIIIKIDSESTIGGMKDDFLPNGKRIPDIGFISEIEFILAQNS